MVKLEQVTKTKEVTCFFHVERKKEMRETKEIVAYLGDLRVIEFDVERENKVVYAITHTESVLSNRELGNYLKVDNKELKRKTKKHKGKLHHEETREISYFMDIVSAIEYVKGIKGYDKRETL